MAKTLLVLFLVALAGCASVRQSIRSHTPTLEQDAVNYPTSTEKRLFGK